MASEQFSSDPTSGGVQAGEESPKPTFLSKVKAKAHQLKSKLKNHGSEDSQDEAPASGDDPQAYTKGSAAQDGNRYDVSSTPMNSAAFPRPQRPAGATDPKSHGNPFGAVSSGQTGYGMDSMKTDDKSFSVDPAVLKSDGPPDVQQAVPTSYSYFNSDPEQARLPSDSDASQRQPDVSSTSGGLSAELTPAMENLSAGTENHSVQPDETLSKSADRDSELPLSSMSSERDDVGLVEPSQPSQDSLSSHPIDQDDVITEKASNHDELAAGMGNKFGQSKDWSGESSNADAQIPQQKVFQKSLSNDGGSKRVHSGLRSSSDPELRGRSNTESEGDGFAPDISGTAGASDLSANDSEQKPMSTKIADTGKDSLASTLGYDDTSTSQGKDSAASDFSANGGEQEPMLNRGTDTANELTDTASSKLGDADQAMSTDSTPVSQKVTDSAVQAKESASSNLSAEDGEEKPLINRETETPDGLKDTDASKLGYADQDTSTDSTPLSQKATDNAEHGNNYAANQLSDADQALSSDEKPVSAKTNEAATQAKDGLKQNTAPAQHDKAFADSVTESVTSLPGMLTSKLGLGGGSTTSSPTTATTQTGSGFKDGSDMPASTTPTSDASNYDPSTRKDTPHPDHPAPHIPGIFDRVSGLASSLFGGGAKQPATPREGEKSS
jgi:hypothetical protein